MNRDNIEEILKSIGAEDVPADVHKIAQETSNNFSRSLETSTQPKQPIVWEYIMRNRITKIAAAAVVMIVCVIGLSLWRTTGSGIALADVLAQIEKVKAFRFQWNVKVTGEITDDDPNKPYSSEGRGTILVSQEYGLKNKDESLDPNGGESTFTECYFSPEKKTLIGITPKQKQYWRTEFDDVTAEQWQWQDEGPHTFLKEILKYKYESLGRSTIDGIEVEGFRTTDLNYTGFKPSQVDVKIWVDVKTRLPVRYERDIMYGKMRTRIAQYDFQWDVPVAAADFEPVIPEDYTGIVIKYPAHITEETVIQGLKLLVELLGKYPENIIKVRDHFNATVLRVLRLAEKSETPAAMRLKEESKGLSDDEITNKLVDFWMPIRGLAGFCYRLEDDKKDPAYYGKTVTPKDTDKVLLRWKVSDSEYRVIYGDLHAETVTPEKLAELEAALPK
jgi:hypothetical protein